MALRVGVAAFRCMSWQRTKAGQQRQRQQQRQDFTGYVLHVIFLRFRFWRAGSERLPAAVYRKRKKRC